VPETHFVWPQGTHFPTVTATGFQGSLGTLLQFGSIQTLHFWLFSMFLQSVRQKSASQLKLLLLLYSCYMIAMNILPMYLEQWLSLFSALTDYFIKTSHTLETTHELLYVNQSSTMMFFEPGNIQSLDAHCFFIYILQQTFYSYYALQVWQSMCNVLIDTLWLDTPW
jgi:hypothetical protein